MDGFPSRKGTVTWFGDPVQCNARKDYPGIFT